MIKHGISSFEFIINSVEPLKMCMTKQNIIILIFVICILGNQGIPKNTLRISVFFDFSTSVQNILDFIQLSYLFIAHTGRAALFLDRILFFGLKAFIFNFIMLDQLICATIVSIPFVENVLANFIEGFCNIQIEGEQILDNLFVNLIAFIVHLLF